MNIIPWDGRPISKPGMYSGVDIEAYHSGGLCVGPSLSSTGLRTIFMRSEAHFYDAWPRNPNYDPAAREEKETEGFILGRATHHLLMSQLHFDKLFVVPPSKTPDAKGIMQDWSLRFDSAKKWRDDALKKRLTIITPAMAEKIKGMADRLKREPLVMAGALSGLPEITMAWKDSESGVWLLSRPDVIPTDSGDMTDLKTTRDVVSHPNLVRAIGEYGYHMQAALAGEGWRILTGQALASFSFYFVESCRPHCARMVRLKDHSLLLGTRQNRNAIRRFVKAMNTGFWPGPGGLQEAVANIDISDMKALAIEGELRFQGEADQEREQAREKAA